MKPRVGDVMRVEHRELYYVIVDECCSTLGDEFVVMLLFDDKGIYPGGQLFRWLATTVDRDVMIAEGS